MNLTINYILQFIWPIKNINYKKNLIDSKIFHMEGHLSGTLAIDLGNTNTVVAFQDQKDINSILVEIPTITSSPGVIPSVVWFNEPSKILKIGISALKMRNSSNSDLYFHSNFKRLIGNPIEKINKKNILKPTECG